MKKRTQIARNLKSILKRFSRKRGTKEGRDFLAWITNEKIQELSIEHKSLIVEALHGNVSGPFYDEAVEKIILSVRGRDLMKLKNMIDRGPGVSNLKDLVFDSIRSRLVRHSLLSHFEEEAVKLGPQGVKILSDIDDTYYASWSDKRFPKKSIYPGVGQFFKELILFQNESFGEKTTPIFITARPRELASFLVNKAQNMFEAAGIPAPTIIPGDLMHWVGNRRIADKKFENFKCYSRLFPEYDFIFIGDSGQGDARLGQKMVKFAQNRVRAILIHDVAKVNIRKIQHLQKYRIHFFDTYVGAAIHAFHLHLLGKDALKRIERRAKHDMKKLKFENKNQEKLRLQELKSDSALLKEVLSAIRS